MKKFLFALPALLFIACKNQEIREYVPKEDQYVTVHNNGGSYFFPDDGMYGLTSQYISKEQYDSLKSFSYEMEKENIDLKSAKAKELMALTRDTTTLIGNLLREYLYDENDVDDVWGPNGLGAIHRISYYKQTDQYELNIPQPIETISFMLNGEKADTTFLKSEDSSYAKNGLYAGRVGQDCDFCCDICFYLYDESNRRMVPVGQYQNLHWDFCEYSGENDSGEMKWIAPGKLLCKGFRDIYDKTWEWNDSISKSKGEVDSEAYDSRLGYPVYSLITLTKKH